jgi:hypothetical protein
MRSRVRFSGLNQPGQDQASGECGTEHGLPHDSVQLEEADALRSDLDVRFRSDLDVRFSRLKQSGQGQAYSECGTQRRLPHNSVQLQEPYAIQNLQVLLRIVDQRDRLQAPSRGVNMITIIKITEITTIMITIKTTTITRFQSED